VTGARPVILAHPVVEPLARAGLRKPAAEIIEQPFLGALRVGAGFDSDTVGFEQPHGRAARGALIAGGKGFSPAIATSAIQASRNGP
jgi:hypothetical protein